MILFVANTAIQVDDGRHYLPRPDFEFIKTSSEQIYNILEKMKGFKHMRYSNGNKTIHDVFEGAFKIISISNTNYEHQIDDKLKFSNYF